MGRKGALDSETDAAFIKELDGWAWVLPGTGFYPVSTFLAGRLGRRASPQGQPLSPSFLLSLSGVTGLLAGSLNDSPLPQPISPPPPTTCRPTHTLRIQLTRMLIGNSLAFPASLSNPGRRGLSQGHTVRSKEEPRGWTKGLPRQSTCAADSLFVGDRSPSRLTANGVLLQSLSCSPRLCCCSPQPYHLSPKSQMPQPCPAVFSLVRFRMSHPPPWTKFLCAGSQLRHPGKPGVARAGPAAACVGQSQVSLWVLLWLQAGITLPHTHLQEASALLTSMWTFWPEHLFSQVRMGCWREGQGKVKSHPFPVWCYCSVILVDSRKWARI